MSRDGGEFYGFLKISEGIEDVRRCGSVLHSVSELLFEALTGLMCGANSWEDLETFAENKLVGLTRNDYSECHPLERGNPQVFEKSGFPFSRE